MQKVAVVGHKSEQEKLVDFLHQEGVMEVSDLRAPSTLDHTKVNFRASELDHVIARLTEVATKAQLAEAASQASEQEIIAAATEHNIRGIIDGVLSLERTTGELKHALHELEHGRLPAPVLEQNLAEEGVYFTSSAVRSDLSHFGGETAPEALDATSTEVQKRQEEVEKFLHEKHDALSTMAEHLAVLTRARQYVTWLDQKQALRDTMQRTRTTVTLFGWIAKKLFDPLEEKLHHLSPATAILPVEPKPGETAPIQLKNPIWLQPFESVTMLYGLPQAHEFDPTPLLAPFFILFFGLCLTDAAYGLILAGVMGAFLWKKKLTIQKAPLWWLLFIGGIATFLISIPFGGWFGLSPDQAPGFLTETRSDGRLWFKGQIWNLGETPGITFFQNLSLVLGLIHLSFGMFLAGFAKWLSGQKAAAFWVDWTTLVMFAAALGVFYAPPEYAQHALYTLYASLALVFWGKGHGSSLASRPLNGLLGVLNLAMGMLSNTLSYLRLLALGLVTGALALAVNLVAEQMGAMFPAIIGIPLSIAIYLLGHTMNIALNVLGAFIHSGRLQFVEFFSQFFEGGGRPFTPYRRS